MDIDAIDNNTSDTDSIVNKQSTNDAENVISMIQLEITERLLPVAVILYFLVFTGIIGNIFAIVFYARVSKRTPPTLLITCLAAADLGTCLAALPIISEMVINLDYSQAILCKITHFIGLWVGACACYILWLISIDRYRKICSPLAKQMLLSTVKYLVIGIISFSFLLAGRLLATFNTVQVEVKDVETNKSATGIYCATDEEFNLISLIFYSIDFLMILMIWITIVVTYSRIIYTLVKRRLSMTGCSLSTQNSQYVPKVSTKKNISRDKKTIRKHLHPTRSNHNIELDDISCSEMTTEETEIYTIANGNERQADKRCNTPKKRSQKTNFEFTSVKKPSEIKLTLMMFAVSMIFILCFTPYFAVRIFIRLVLHSGKEYDFSAWIQFALKLPYINSALNPIVYYFFNPKLRRYVYSCFRTCRCKSKDKVEITN